MTITLAAGVSLGAVHAITEEPIAAQEKKKKEDACKAVFPEAETFEAWEEFDEEKAEELLTLAGFTADKIGISGLWLIAGLIFLTGTGSAAALLWHMQKPHREGQRSKKTQTQKPADREDMV